MAVRTNSTTSPAGLAFSAVLGASAQASALVTPGGLTFVSVLGVGIGTTSRGGLVLAATLGSPVVTTSSKVVPQALGLVAVLDAPTVLTIAIPTLDLILGVMSGWAVGAPSRWSVGRADRVPVVGESDRWHVGAATRGWS